MQYTLGSLRNIQNTMNKTLARMSKILNTTGIPRQPETWHVWRPVKCGAIFVLGTV